MKKVRMIILFMTLFLGMLFLMPVKVFADSTFDGTADDWFNYISQLDYSYGFARAEIYQTQDDYWYEDFGLLIVEEPSHEVEGCIFEYSRSYSSEYWIYFKPSLASFLKNEIRDDYYADIVGFLESEYGEDFDGFLYWNFEQQYWQVEQYGTTELDYYKQRVNDLEDEIQQLEDEISSLEDEISSLEDEISSLENQISSLQNIISSLEDEISSLENEISSLQNIISSLEDEISSLENEIQQLENALDLEFDRGYNEGYQVGYSDGLLVENNDIDIIKWFVPLVVIIIVVGIIEPIIILKRRG